MNAQFFINEIGCNFNLRKPKSEKPTNVYFVARVRNKQIKLSTGVRVYPDQWNVKKQEAYISCRLTELDNENNTIVNEKINKLKLYFSEYKQYLCDHPEEIERRAIILLKQYIYKDTMKKKTEKPATFTMKQIIEEKDIVDSSKDQYRFNIDKFKRFLDENSISDAWESMNLDTFTKYQQHLIKDGKKASTVKNIMKGTFFGILRKASKRPDIPFKWEESDLDSFELVKDKSNKELARNKEVALTEEQIKQLYEYQPSGTENQIKKKTEIKDLFVLQCLVGQRISDMQKFFNGDNERDEENGTISIIQKKTGSRAIIPLVPMAEEIINKYIGKENKYYKESRRELNNELRTIAQEAGLNEPITYEENGTKYTKPLYELLHTHSARHTFSTIMCRRGVPREDIIIATGHEDTQMLDKIYAHLTAKDKSKKVTNAFKKKLGDGIFDMGGQTEPENVPEKPSGENLMVMDCNLILKMIKEGIAEGLKPLQQELADVKQVIRHITGHKRAIQRINIQRIVDMVVSLRKDNTPEPTIIRMLDNSGMLKVTFSNVMTCDQFFLTPENFHPAGEYLLDKVERAIGIREHKKKR